MYIQERINQSIQTHKSLFSNEVGFNGPTNLILAFNSSRLRSAFDSVILFLASSRIWLAFLPLPLPLPLCPLAALGARSLSFSPGVGDSTCESRLSFMLVLRDLSGDLGGGGKRVLWT